MTSTEPTIRETYLDACAALKGLAQLVVAAEAAQFATPPGAVYGKGTEGDMVGVGNPTADAVLDPRRMGLSDDVRDLTGFLRVTAHSLRVRTERLDRSLSRWEGHAAPAQQTA